MEATGTDPAGQGDAAGAGQGEAGSADPGSGAGEATGSVEGAGASKSAAESGEGADSPKDAAEHREDAGASKSAVATDEDAASPNDAAEHGAGAAPPTDAQASSEPTSTGRYVELSSGDDKSESPGAGSDGGGEAKDVQEEPRSGPVSGVDDALLNAGIWDVASRASQEEPGSAGADGSEDVATPGEEPRVEAVEPRVMGQVTAMVLPLERLEEDTTFRLRDEGDVSELATDLARLGQLFPVDVRPRGDERYQLICGFRRVAALRFLKRDHVQVRVHEELSDEDALLLSLADAIHASPVEHDVLEAKRNSLEAEGRLTAPVRDMLEKALATEETLAPEGVEEEIDADELASDVAQRMGALNQDLSLLADVFAALDESRRAELLMQLRYSAQLVAYLEGL
ncbi:ParB/RepB/Spo0J family partition protein [Corallococcus llansteffanensis]|uniref:ParB/RepB/Spo0J family partition protein n=1 Tax=Corallococcus llansteffanensis TaxID=2316731 RepID=UPI001FCA2F2D|nr:ParB/RepB/Spo0J family partition protein [Corallococcus llansteffanensis]